MAIEQMASKGEANLNRKLPNMGASYEASRGRAVEGYRAVGFGPTRTGNYESSWSTNPTNYRAGMTADKIAKWRRNWVAKMRE